MSKFLELCDSGDTEETFTQGVRVRLGQVVTVPIAKHSELHKFAVILKR